MSWGRTKMESKREFVILAGKAGSNMRALCRQFGVSPTAGYALLRRFQAEGDAGLNERSRRPERSPRQTDPALEQVVLDLRDETHWGARKLSRRLQDIGKIKELHRSTVHSILKRNGRIEPAESAKREPWHRFEHANPNELLQMDFKGWIQTGAGRCHPLTVLDDHSRFALCLEACAEETTQTVQQRLTRVFRRYGLPWRMTMDNGSPWGDEGGNRLTKLTAWLVRMGVRVSHSRPYHPQTQGKDERFHESLNAELLRWITFRDLKDAQAHFDRWRDRYNLERPHESLGMNTPIARYRPSPRLMPETLPPIEYDSTDEVRKADGYGKISFKGRIVRVGKGCSGMQVAVRATITDGRFEVFFCHQRVAEIDLVGSRESSDPADSSTPRAAEQARQAGSGEEGLTGLFRGPTTLHQPDRSTP